VEQKRQQADADDRRATRLAKKPYATPVVTEYGSVAKLTQSGAGSISDGSFINSQLKSCL
jgi:hypothetical protein